MWPFEKTARYISLNRTSLDEPELDKTEIAKDHEWPERPRRVCGGFVWYLHLGLAAIWILAFSAVVVHRPESSNNLNPDKTSPLRNILSYSPLRFTEGLAGSTTVYQGPPSTSNNAHWNHLTNTGIVALTASEHSALLTTSVPFSSSPQTYLGAVEVFHQLHCLDMLRLKVYGNLTQWLHEHHSHKDEMEHVDHCIDYLRQSMMCRPSIEILPFDFHEESNSFSPRFDSTHTCADFEAVRSWAVERQAGEFTPQ